MSKLRLNLEALVVESFDTAEHPRGAGTVLGNADGCGCPSNGCPPPVSADETCCVYTYEPCTCVPVETCSCAQPWDAAA